MFHPNGPTFWELAQQALSSTERGYDMLAPKFDYTPFRTPDALLASVAPHLGPPKSIDAALDVGCGTGAAMRFLRPLCRKRVVGLDFSQGMLDEAQRRLANAPGDAELQWLRGDVLDPHFSSEFDLAVCFGMLGHILRQDQSRFVDQVCRALKPSGRFVFVTSTAPARLSPHYWLARSFNAAMRVRNLLHAPPFIMYYMSFLLPEARTLLAERGFQVEVRNDALPQPFAQLA